jgi:hypothetical protein
MSVLFYHGGSHGSDVQFVFLELLYLELMSFASVFT